MRWIFTILCCDGCDDSNVVRGGGGDAGGTVRGLPCVQELPPEPKNTTKGLIDIVGNNGVKQSLAWSRVELQPAKPGSAVVLIKENTSYQ